MLALPWKKSKKHLDCDLVIQEAYEALNYFNWSEKSYLLTRNRSSVLWTIQATENPGNRIINKV